MGNGPARELLRLRPCKPYEHHEHIIKSERSEKKVKGQSSRFAHMNINLEAVAGPNSIRMLKAGRYHGKPNELYKSTYLINRVSGFVIDT